MAQGTKPKQWGTQIGPRAGPVPFTSANDPTWGPTDTQGRTDPTVMGWLRRGVRLSGGLLILLAWGVPLLVDTTFGSDTVEPLRVAGTAAAEFGRDLRWIAWLAVVAAVAVEAVNWHAWRQRRRLARQISNRFSVRTSGRPVKVIVGWRCPRRGVVPIMPGYMFKPDAIAATEEHLTSAWGRAYAVDYDTRHDRIVARRLPRKKQAAREGDQEREYVDAIHERLHNVSAAPLKQKSVDAQTVAEEGGGTRTWYKFVYEPDHRAGEPEFQRKVVASIQQQVGETANNLPLEVVWHPEQDTLWLTEQRPDEVRYIDSIHQRLEHVKPAMPKGFTVTTVTPNMIADEDGNNQQAYTLAYDPTFALTRTATQENVADAISTLVGTGPNGGRLEANWRIDEDQVDLTEVPSLRSRIEHPVIGDYNSFLRSSRLWIPFGEFAGGRPMVWDVDPRSTTPHALFCGPTGGGKTVLERAVIIEGVRLGIPWLPFDPKFFELAELDDYPGVFTVVSDPMHMVDALDVAYEEHQARKKAIRKERLDPGNPSEVPLWGLCFDELLIMGSLLTRLAKRDETVKHRDPLGKYSELIHEVRATGGRIINTAQRPDAKVWGTGSPRMNMGCRVALSRLDRDGDDMMFPGGQYYTRHLDASVPGRAMATRPVGPPREGQVWYTPNVDAHPRPSAARSTEEQRLVDALKPTTPPSLEMFLPRHKLEPWFRRADPDLAGPTHQRPPDRDACRAHQVAPGWTVVLDDSGEDVTAVVEDVVEDGALIELEVRYVDDGERRTLSLDRDELIGIVSRDDEQ